mmetsp:Transcript_34591/g.81066  ORF Transcript_34591/g.81066 Transcript_34591/m.81066 type:complete len:253 (+) Transcript_34591:1060-1818(+)
MDRGGGVLSDGPILGSGARGRFEEARFENSHKDLVRARLPHATHQTAPCSREMNTQKATTVALAVRTRAPRGASPEGGSARSRITQSALGPADARGSDLVQWHVGHHDAILVGVDILPRGDAHAPKHHVNVPAPRVLLVRLDGVRVERLHPDGHVRDGRAVPDAPVHNDSSPPVFDPDFGDHVTQHGTSHRSASIHHQHPAVAWLLEGFLDGRVALKGLDGRHRTGKRHLATVVFEVEGRVHDLDLCLLGKL